LFSALAASLGQTREESGEHNGIVCLRTGQTIMSWRGWAIFYLDMLAKQAIAKLEKL
jgi:hypothetical protein